MTGLRTSSSPGFLASFGITRLCLLLSFVLLASTTYFCVDAHTVQRVLLKVQSDPYGSLHLFLLLYIASVILLFPCMVLQVMSGALYGFWMGLLVSWVATSLGQALAFLLGRYLFRPTVKSYLHSTWPTFPAIDAAIKREGWKLVCLLRLSPVLPYNILNYALAVTPVTFWVFSLASALATVPWTALYVYLGTFSTNLMDLAQGKIYYGKDTHLTRSLLSGLFIVVTSVWGYTVSQRAIASVLKEAAEQADAADAPGSQLGVPGGSGGGGGGTASAGGAGGRGRAEERGSRVSNGGGGGAVEGMSDRSRDVELGRS
ncbi:snare associated Golgi protein-domain-containing protein [Haematococcus lacustris]